MSKPNYKHGDYKQRLFSIWQGMLNRSGKSKYYKHVSVCDEWRQYLSFKKWAIASGYNETLSIDRINNKKGYSPENCKWSTPKEQAHNRKTTITYLGETASEAGLRLGGTPAMVARRIRDGMSIEEAFTRPKMRNKKNVWTK